MFDLSLLVFWRYWLYIEPYVCNKYHDISMMAYEFEIIAILNIIGFVYK